MIIPASRSNVYIKDLPFKADFNTKEMKVSFSGYVINCYDDSKNIDNDFTNGCSYFLVKGSFDVGFGDWFYVDARYQTEYSLIKKVTKEERENFPRDLFEIPILIWKAPKEKDASPEQILSENIFIQDYEASRKKGLRLYGKSFYPGFVINPTKNYSKYIEPFEVENESLVRIKVSVTATASSPDETDDGEVKYLMDFDITGVDVETYEEEEEDDKIYLSLSGDHLSGFYYAKIPPINADSGGVIILDFFPSEIEGAEISPSWETQVRGAKFYKNGVSTSLFNPDDIEGDEGFYSTINEEKIYDLYTVNMDGLVEVTGEHSVVTVFSVENSQNVISELPPVITVEVNEDPLGEDDFILEAKETIVTPQGGEISSDAFAACKGVALEFDFTPIESWEGDQTVVLQGAGQQGGEEKLEIFVIYGERRFKKVGILDKEPEDTDDLPDSFMHHSIIQWSDGIFVDISEAISFDKQRDIYTDKRWREIEIKGDGVYGIELIKNALALEGGDSLRRNITINVKKKYQTLEMSATPSVVV